MRTCSATAGCSDSMCRLQPGTFERCQSRLASGDPKTFAGGTPAVVEFLRHTSYQGSCSPPMQLIPNKPLQHKLVLGVHTGGGCPCLCRIRANYKVRSGRINVAKGTQLFEHKWHREREVDREVQLQFLEVECDRKYLGATTLGEPKAVRRCYNSCLFTGTCPNKTPQKPCKPIYFAFMQGPFFPLTWA
jgi:hypothetical protein